MSRRRNLQFLAEQQNRMRRLKLNLSKAAWVKCCVNSDRKRLRPETTSDIIDELRRAFSRRRLPLPHVDAARDARGFFQPDRCSRDAARRTKALVESRPANLLRSATPGCAFAG